MTEQEIQHPQKTVNSILTHICSVLEQADKLVNHEDLSEKTASLRDSLMSLSPSDLTEMSQHINAMYQACENMKITHIAFRCDTDTKRIIAIIGIQFGVREIELFAPFDDSGAKNMLKEISGSLALLDSTGLIIPKLEMLEIN